MIFRGIFYIAKFMIFKINLFPWFVRFYGMIFIERKGTNEGR